VRDEAEEVLSGGNAGGEVVRRGGTVRKVWTASTPSVLAFVGALRARGVDVPASLGRDERGRQVQEFVPGRLAMHSGPLPTAGLQRVGSLVRAIHDASARFEPSADAMWETAVAAPAAELVCHNDLAPWNLIVGERWVFIDWDASAPSTRLWDLAYAAQTFTLNDPGRTPADAASALAALVDGYRADERMRAALPDAMAARTAAMHDLLRSSHAAGREPWASMHVAGHGEHWASATRYVAENQRAWAAALSSGD